MSSRPTRQEAWEILTANVKSESQLRHALAVEGVMRHLARREGANEEQWGIIGLVHDVDYELYPEEHCQHAPQILGEHGWPEEYIRAVVSHGWGLCSDVKPERALEKWLYAVDELTGLVAAAALVRPSRSVMDLKVKSVRKKWKNKKFAAGVDREVILKGAELLGVDLPELINETILGMREVAEAIGLKGEG